MSHDYNNPAFKKLLQKLQEESWQLELPISGFAIFGLFTAFPHIKVAALAAENDEKIYSFIVLIYKHQDCFFIKGSLYKCNMNIKTYQLSGGQASIIIKVDRHEAI